MSDVLYFYLVSTLPLTVEDDYMPRYFALSYIGELVMSLNYLLVLIYLIYL